MIIINPQQAIAEYLGEQFIEWLGSFIVHDMATWPFMAQIKQVRPKPDKLNKFMAQKFLATEAWFGRKSGDPGFLRFAIANLSESNDPLAEVPLEILEKRRQDELAGHPVAWLSFLQALGLSLDEIERLKSKEMTRHYIADLSDVYSNSEWQTVLGAVFAQELSEQEERQSYLPMLKQANFTDKDLEMFMPKPPPLAKFTQHLLDKIVFDPESKALVWEGVKKQLDIRREFLSAIGKYLE